MEKVHSSVRLDTASAQEDFVMDCINVQASVKRNIVVSAIFGPFTHVEAIRNLPAHTKTKIHVNPLIGR